MCYRRLLDEKMNNCSKKSSINKKKGDILLKGSRTVVGLAKSNYLPPQKSGSNRKEKDLKE